MSMMTMEGRRFKTDLIPLSTDDSDRHRKNATRGSARLRDAVLRAKGHLVPERHNKPTAQAPKPAPHPPECCDKCGAPIRPSGGLISHIQATVASYYGLHKSTMVSQRRAQDISHPRQIAMFLATELTPKSLPTIGRYFGGRDHTTVIHAIRAVAKRVANDPEIAEDVRVLRERLGG